MQFRIWAAPTRMILETAHVSEMPSCEGVRAIVA